MGGFAFILFGLPTLVISLLILILYPNRIKNALKMVCGIAVIAILLLTIGSIANYLRSPINLNRQLIAGEYRIDTTFYPGKNARWQYDRHKFRITNTDSIYFLIMDANQGTSKVYGYKIHYSSGQPYLWSVANHPAYHAINNTPILYRSHNRFYYVFHSNKFGNMFFRQSAIGDSNQ